MDTSSMKEKSQSPLDLSQPVKPECADFARRMHGLPDGKPKDESTVTKASKGMENIFDLMAAGLYSLASMLVGEGEESIRLVESAVANSEVSACCNPEQARTSSRRVLTREALEMLARRDPASLAAPQGVEHVSTCIEDDDLDAAGVSRDEFNRMLAGPDRDRVRTWLESLPTALRTVFVLRAVAGFTSSETAELLVAHAGPKAVGWNAEAVRELFRQALCSLASQLLQAGILK